MFFDTLGIAWQYEPEGLECSRRLSDWCNDDAPSHLWLPDFWLPKLNMFAEVKGVLTAPEAERLLDCIAAVSAPGGGCGQGPNTVILGPIPKPLSASFPIVLHMHKGDLLAQVWEGQPTGCVGQSHYSVGDDYDGINFATAVGLVNGIEHASDVYWCDAYAAARSARFEHGESGAT